MSTGMDYSQLRKVYSINIVYFDIGQGNDYVYNGTTNFIGKHQKDELQLSSRQRNLFSKEHVYEIYPEYIIIKVNKFDDKTIDELDQWIYYFKHNYLPDNYSAKGLEMLSKKLAYEKLDTMGKLEYDAHVKELEI
jgi:hypothetical protein